MSPNDLVTEKGTAVPVHRQQVNRWVWLTLLLTYVVSMMLPAFYMPGFGGPPSGIRGSVLLGYEMAFHLPFAMLTIAWWANPVWMLGLRCLAQGNWKWARRLGLIATLLALSVFLFGVTPPDQVQLSQFYAGYYVWLACMIGEFVAAQLLDVRRDRSPQS